MTMTHDALRKLAEAATPGPWEAITLGRDEYPSEVWYAENMRVCLMPSNVKGENAAFISAANPKKVLELLDRIAELEGAVRDFASQILHGDHIHQAWLMEAAECFIQGRPLPAPRDKSTAEKDMVFP